MDGLGCGSSKPVMEQSKATAEKPSLQVIFSYRRKLHVNKSMANVACFHGAFAIEISKVSALPPPGNIPSLNTSTRRHVP